MMKSKDVDVHLCGIGRDAAIIRRSGKKLNSWQIQLAREAVCDIEAAITMSRDSDKTDAPVGEI